MRFLWFSALNWIVRDEWCYLSCSGVSRICQWICFLCWGAHDTYTLFSGIFVFILTIHPKQWDPSFLCVFQLFSCFFGWDNTQAESLSVVRLRGDGRLLYYKRIRKIKWEIEEYVPDACILNSASLKLNNYYGTVKRDVNMASYN